MLALPKISKDFDISSSLSTQAVTIGLIVTVIFLVIFGHMGDLISKNFIYLLGGALFGLSGLITGFAPNFPIMIVGLIVQAIGGAATAANSMGIITDTFVDKERSTALAYNSMFVSVGSLSGSPIGGLITQFFGWHWLFLMNVPLMLILMLIGSRILKVGKIDGRKIAMDLKESNWTGQAIYTVGILVMFGANWFAIPHVNPFVNFMIFLVIGGIITVYSFLQDDKAKHPWIDPKVLHNIIFLTSTGVLFLSMFVNAMSNIMLPFYLQNFLGYNVGVSGLIVALQSVTMFVLSPIVGKLAAKANRQQFLVTIGLIMLTISQVGYALYPAHQNLLWIIIPIVVNGIGMGFTLTPNNTLTMSLVAPNDTGIAGSVNSLFRTLGMAMGITFTTTLLAVEIPGVKQISSSLGNTFMNAFRFIFIIAALISAASIVLNLVRKTK